VIVLCVEGGGGVDRMPVEIQVGGWTESTNQSTDQLDQLIDLTRYTRRWGSGRTRLSSLHFSSPADWSTLLLLLQVSGKKGLKRLQSLSAEWQLILG